MTTGARAHLDVPLDPERQLTIMNSRVAGLLAQDEDRWELFGDQLYIDIELSEANLPVGTRLAIGWRCH